MEPGKYRTCTMRASSKSEANTKPSVCFVSHSAYGELAGVDTGHVGGIEHQQAMMARWLARKGYRVSMLTWDEGQRDGQDVAGVGVYKMCRQDAGIRGIRFVHPRWTSLWRALERADADIYYYNCGDLALGQVALWCRCHRRKSIFSVASDADCDPRLPALARRRERILYLYGLRHVDRVITQTRRQQELLRSGFGMDSQVLPMPCDGPEDGHYVRPEPPSADSPCILWVGRVSAEKRFEWLLDIAERCSDASFDVVGAANAESDHASTLTKRAASIANVAMHGRVPRCRIAEFFRRAALLCCTSAFEGFPNTFLEAWSHGLPVVSSFDPDNLIITRGLGTPAEDVAGLSDAIKGLVESPEQWRQASQRAREYFLANHTVDVVLPQFERVFLELGHVRRGVHH